MAELGPLHMVSTSRLDVACHLAGPLEGPPVVLLHGFPYDGQAYADVSPLLVAQGCRVIVPWLRGHGRTRFRNDSVPRSGQQAAIGDDLRVLMDSLGIQSAVLAGYDWGGRAACVVAALWPDRCRGLVSGNGYLIQDIAHAAEPLAPEREAAYWYQYYFHGERGRAGLTANRRALARFLWRTWSPTWEFDDDTFSRTAAAFDNPDWVDVVIHSYRHRQGLVPGDPSYEDLERALAARPTIAAPTITLDGADDTVTPPTDGSAHARFFTGPRTHLVLPGAGHALPQEAPVEFAGAIMSLLGNMSIADTAKGNRLRAGDAP